LAAEVNGIDVITANVMRKNVTDGRFTAEHYVNMWKQRLVDAGVPVFMTHKESEADAKKRKKGHDKRVADAMAKKQAADLERAVPSRSIQQMYHFSQQLRCGILI
jgi:hypothetical protein